MTSVLIVDCPRVQLTANIIVPNRWHRSSFAVPALYYGDNCSILIIKQDRRLAQLHVGLRE